MRASQLTGASSCRSAATPPWQLGGRGHSQRAGSANLRSGCLTCSYCVFILARSARNFSWASESAIVKLARSTCDGGRG
eukprot:scaffold5390_cov116-Isochrysis_galbana.AAC.12